MKNIGIICKDMELFLSLKRALNLPPSGYKVDCIISLDDNPFGFILEKIGNNFTIDTGIDRIILIPGETDEVEIEVVALVRLLSHLPIVMISSGNKDKGFNKEHGIHYLPIPFCLKELHTVMGQSKEFEIEKNSLNNLKKYAKRGVDKIINSCKHSMSGLFEIPASRIDILYKKPDESTFKKIQCSIKDKAIEEAKRILGELRVKCSSKFIREVYGESKEIEEIDVKISLIENLLELNYKKAIQNNNLVALKQSVDYLCNLKKRRS